MAKGPKRDRQIATDLSGIRLGHIFRYTFSKPMARGSVLDCAAGCGYGSWILADGDKCTVTAVDISREAIDHGRRHFGHPHIEWVVGDALDKPWGEQKFDLVVSLETLEHLSEPERLLKHFQQSLNPGGKFIASVPNEEKYPFDPERFKDEEYPHQRHYTPAEFEELLNSGGFRVIHRGTQLQKQDPIVNGSGGLFLIYTCELWQT